jgi:cobalamin biosynthesis protein CobT
MPGAMKRAIKQIESEGKIELYSIGIMSDSVKHFYKNFKVINSAADLEEALLGLISNRVMGI